MARKMVGLLVLLLLVAIVMLFLQQVQQTGRGPAQAAYTSQPDFVGWVMEVDPGAGHIQVESQAD
ncbi:MAG: hypothetical protein ACM3PS_05555, partial [Syntrophothermus sp.]